MASYSSKSRDFASRQGALLLGMALTISLLSAWLAYIGEPENLNWLHYDQSQAYSSLPAADDMVIIEIDDYSLGELGHWPWPRQQHAKLITMLEEAGAALIVFDLLFPSSDTANPQSDQDFAQAIASSGKVILPLFFETKGAQGVVVETPPHQSFQAGAAALGHIHLARENDGVVRSVFLKEGINTPYWPHLALATLEQAQDQRLMNIPGQQLTKTQTSDHTIGMTRDYYNLVPMPAAEQGIRYFSYSDVVRGHIDTQRLQNKIVFIGATATGLGDLLTTPVGNMHGVELNAWIFHALRHQRLIQPIAPPKLAALTFSVVFALVMVLGSLSPRLFLIFTLSSVATILAGSSALLLYAGIWLPSAAAAIGLCLFFPLWSWLRAESMLRYLRLESARLTQSGDRKQEYSPQRSAAFLARLGMIDAETYHVSPIGKQALTALQLQLPLEADQPAGDGPQEFAPVSELASTPERQGDHVAGVELITRTIAQLSQARKKDQRNRQLIEQSLSGLLDGVCIAQLNGQIAYCNQRFKNWFLGGAEPDGDTDLLAVLDTLVLQSGRSWPQVLQKLYLNPEPLSDEGTLRHSLPDTPAHLFCRASLVQTWTDRIDTLIFTFTDVSQLKAAEQARAEALSFLSHDLRSPMVSVLATLSRLEATDRGLPPQEVRNVEVLVRKNLDYAESFLQLSRADSLPDSDVTPCDLHAVLDGAQVHAQALAAAKSIRVSIDRCVEDCWVMGEMSLLERAVNNLVSNAIKYSPAHTLVTIALRREQEHCVLSVKDQGPGISQDDQANLFKRFTRKKGDKTHGAGLGLSFVAAVASKFHGEVRVLSEPGKGAEFSLVLPALQEDEQVW
ncbi:MAG: CHASE2 domain-containing protein [Oleiphilaceae bacterium]|nr:CHASE2 domain-containing protein [Oleiphilaceae bacterium]